MSRDIKDTWEYFGENDPYFAVITDEKYKSKNMTEAGQFEFFESGENHIQRVWAEIENNFISDFRPLRALDFGCGVGRLVIPLARRCAEVTGVDISREMLREADRNCQRLGISNANLSKTEEFLGKDVGKFDFVHSFIVIQHVEPKLGEKIISRLIDVLQDNGIGAIHLAYAGPQDRFAFFRSKIYRDFPTINRLKNLIRRREHQPVIPLHLYDLNRVFAILQKRGCHKCLVRFSEHGQPGVFIIFQKKFDELY